MDREDKAAQLVVGSVGAIMFWAVFLVVALAPLQAFAATYYMDSVAGNDGNNGTSTTTAWKSVTPINSHTFVAGDQVLFNRGQTFSNAKISLTDDNGVSGNPIIFDAYGTGANPILNAGNTNRVFDIRNSASYITIQNLTLQSPSESGIFLFSGTFTGLNFNHLTFIGTSSQALLLNSNATSTGSTYDNITINGFSTGFNFQSRVIGDVYSNLTITSSSSAMQFGSGSTPVQNISLVNSTASGGTGNCYVFSNVTSATITNITAQSCGAAGADFRNTTQNISITNSTFSGNGTYGIQFENYVTTLTVATTTASNNLSTGIAAVNGFIGALFSGITANSNGSAGLNVGVTSALDTATVMLSTLNNNTDNGFSAGGSAAGVITVNATAASGNLNDGFGVHNNPVVNISNSTSTNNGVNGLGADGDAYSWHDLSSGSLVNSYAWNNKKSGITNVSTSSVTVYNSVFGYDTSPGTNALITLLDNAALSFYNNTLINPSRQGTAFSTGSIGTTTLRNNIIYGFATGLLITGGTHVSEDYDIVANTSVAVGSGGAFVFGAHSLTTDPSFVNVAGGDYHLNTGSPAIGAGTTALCPATDRVGVSRSVQCDIGAYEYVASAVAVSTPQTSGGGGGGFIVGSGPSAPGYQVTPQQAQPGGVPATQSTGSQGTGVITTPSTPSMYVFSKNLSYRMTQLDVLELQKYLNAQGFTIASTGPGSPGSETTYFGTLTYQALIKFQEAHAAAILTPNGLTKGTGYFGPSTRGFVNGK